jgi:hypothetical protein
LAISWDIGLVSNSLLEVCDSLVGVDGKLELELAGTCADVNTTLIRENKIVNL